MLGLEETEAMSDLDKSLSAGLMRKTLMRWIQGRRMNRQLPWLKVIIITCVCIWIVKEEIFIFNVGRIIYENI
jgi:hypothetical protein